MIEELARHLGVESRYTDFYGNEHIVPRESLAALSAAMGYAVTGDDDAARVLSRLRSQDANLQPVYVVSASSPPVLDVRKSRVSWFLEGEDGSVRSGAASDGIALGDKLATGYYRLRVDGEESTVIAVPDSAYLPPALSRRKAWGIAAQLYSLRSRENWGIGDFGDLARLVEIGAGFGAAIVAVNPLHELHLTNPASASPYSPNSRLFLNALYIDVPQAASMLGLRARVPRTVRTLRETEVVDYVSVAGVKLAALRALHASFRRRRGSSSQEFAAFVHAGGPPLRSIAIYEAIMESRKQIDSQTYGWLQWPEELRDPASPAVDAFAREHERDVEFYQFLQWLADAQLSLAAAGRLEIGLYRDLAVGVDANSADVWTDREAYCLNICVGAPPDPLNPRGQNWALPPLDPHTLRSRAYAPYIALLRANMRHAGVLRIDHVMGLMRLFCIPSGADASAGTYLNYRFDEMLGILALESMRNRCMIVGEDLGTVPAGFRERLSAMGIYGCRLLYFEREWDGRFREPERYEPSAVASPGTHDVATLPGFWGGVDVEARKRLGFFADEGAFQGALAERAGARKLLGEALLKDGDLGMDVATRLERAAGDASEDLLFALVRAAYRFLARSAARLLLVQLEDALLQRHQVNTPGTVSEMPNWRRRLSLPLEAFRGDARISALFAAVNDARSQTETPA